MSFENGSIVGEVVGPTIFLDFACPGDAERVSPQSMLMDVLATPISADPTTTPNEYRTRRPTRNRPPPHRKNPTE